MRFLIPSFWRPTAFLLFFAIAMAGRSEGASVQLRFLDSATGFGLRPNVSLSASGFSTNLVVDPSGRSNPRLPNGTYNLSIELENYNPISAAVSIEGNEQKLQFTLDPINSPAEISVKNVSASHRADATLFTGYVSGDDGGAPLENVRIVSSPSGVQTTTDARGFFQLFVPLQSDAEWAAHPAKLFFEKAGYQTDERDNIELAPFGDLIMRVVLFPGAGIKITDEEGKRIGPDPTPFAPHEFITKKDLVAVSSLIQPTNATVRIPRNIRVQLSDGVTVDTMSMETYVKRSLNDEWFSSWGNLNGTNGLNCLMAGSVANRSYAAYYVSHPRGTTYDICATTSCQVYDTDTASTTDDAVGRVPGYVVLDSTDAISRSEYSAENNSLGFSCGDGYTEPSTSGPVCIYDPACQGETRNGHGRGMCQWGTARWATGYRMNGPSSGDTVSNGFPPKDWKWIVTHYYPTLQFVKAQPLIVGDDIKAASSVSARACADDGIASGTGCALLATQTTGTTGVILAGPVQVSADGNNYTWWQIRWNDATNTVGWSVENYLERIVPSVGAPSGLTATAVSTNQIILTWTDTNTFSTGTKIERAYATGGPWLQIKEVAPGITNLSDTVWPGNNYWYRIRSYNVTGNSSYSAKANTTAPADPPVYPAIANRTITEGNTLSFSASASTTPIKQPLADFEGFTIETSSGTVLLRNPRFSTSTTAFVDASPDYSSVTDLFPTGTGKGSRALFVNCNFTNTTAAWLRLTTASATILGNPVIDITQQLSFDIRCDHQIRVAIGVRETTTAAGTIVGSDGGTTGGIEWVGVTGQNVTAPVIPASFAANSWITTTFNFPTASIYNFSGGNGVLSTASGLATLEHIAIVPDGGVGIYNIYIDNLAVVRPRTISYSLDTGAPVGASINGQGGFSWTPTESQGPGVYTIRAIATATGGGTTTRTTNSFTVTVNEVNQAPVLTPIANRTIHAGSTFIFTNTAADADIPTNLLTFSLITAPGGAGIDSSNGVVTWPTSEAVENTTNNFTVRVTDNGVPSLNDNESFTVVVTSPPATQASATDGVVTLNWSAIPGTVYKVQFKDDLNAETWTDLTTIMASGATATVTNSPGEQRYYRIVAQ